MKTSFNPWLKVLTAPRETINHILRETPNRGFWILACIYGFSGALNWFQNMTFGLKMGLLPLFLLALVLSPIWGYIFFSLGSWFIHFTGKWLKGKATFKEVRTAYAWSCVPIIVNVVLWFFLTFIFGRTLFSGLSETLTSSEANILLAVLLIRVLVMIWSFVIFLKMLAEVQRYSMLRAIGNVIISALIVTVIVFILLGISSFLK